MNFVITTWNSCNKAPGHYIKDILSELFSGTKNSAHRDRSDFCDLRLRCPSRTPKIAAISETRESNAALRFKGVMGAPEKFEEKSMCSIFGPYIYVCECFSEKVFASQERVSGLQEKGADLRGSPGTSGEVWGTSGEVRETSGEPLDCFLVPQWENLRGSCRKTSGEVRETSGEVRGLPRSSGEPDSLPATRQICLQILAGGSTLSRYFFEVLLRAIISLLWLTSQDLLLTYLDEFELFHGLGPFSASTVS